MAKKNDRYLLTINNPTEHGLDNETVIEKAINLKPIYFCLSNEIGLEESTPHTHMYICFSNPRSFNTIQNEFMGAHIDASKGTHQENKDYVFKEGKWLDSEKNVTNIKESHYEYGELPQNNQGSRTDIEQLKECIKNGDDDIDIIEKYPQYMFKLNEINIVRNTYNQNKYKNIFRKLNITYIWGDTGIGKSRYVMEKYGFDNVYRITDYKNPFDSYKYEKVVLFEEFRGDLNLKDMLKYLDGYPLTLPCRYANKQACYEDVYIISNIPLDKQYLDVQANENESWRAFIRRINQIMNFNKDGVVIYDDYEHYHDKYGHAPVPIAELSMWNSTNEFSSVKICEESTQALARE